MWPDTRACSSSFFDDRERPFPNGDYGPPDDGTMNVVSGQDAGNDSIRDLARLSRRKKKKPWPERPHPTVPGQQPVTFTCSDCGEQTAATDDVCAECGAPFRKRE